MKITVTKLTDDSLMRKACEFTMHGVKSKMTLDTIYQTEHSPVRTQLFTVEMIDIPTFISVHLVRHSIGVTHFVTSNREDRGGTGEETRYTPINHCMLINAQALIAMARKRLCGQAHLVVQGIMECIKDEVATVDPDLAKYMVRECEYRNGKCSELRPCGNLWSA